jgi:predicted  nucleic acid-binding Zn-ribbon protein
MSQSSALYHLQSLDLQIAETRAYLGEVNAALGSDEVVRKAQARLDKAEAALAPWQTRVKDLELEIQTLTNKAQQTEKRLYSGSVSNPKELQDMQDEVASLKRRRAQLEDNLLEAMIHVEEGRETQAKAVKKLERTKKRWAAGQVDLAKEKETLEASLAALETDRGDAWGALEAASQKAYDSMKPRMAGRPVAMLKDGVCSMCGMRQTTSVVQHVRRGDGLTKCAGCGRVLALE